MPQHERYLLKEEDKQFNLSQLLFLLLLPQAIMSKQAEEVKNLNCSIEEMLYQELLILKVLINFQTLQS
jgi:hypothetical protein